MRFNEDGSENPDFVLNKPAYRNAQILVTGDNFGCGSSREHAPWALLDFGIRCVISTSFADIFYNNCFKNGILPITVSQEDLDKLMDDARPRRQRHADRRPRGRMKSADRTAALSPSTSIDFKRHCLLNGLDDIGLTMEKAGVHRQSSKSATPKAAPGPERATGMTPFIAKRHEYIVFGLLLSGMMSCIVSGLSTAIAAGIGSDFALRWLAAWLPSWAVAFPAVLIVAPIVRRILRHIVQEG
jgi:3-isopropylmalate dehydratase small subunit